MIVNPCITSRSTAALMFICGAAFASLSAQDPSSGRSEAREFRELGPALKLLRTRNARDYAVATSNGIDEANYVKIGGLEQWITIRGEERNNPVLLLLHGGPGDATNPWGYAGFRTWMKYFTVVQWDQRGAGRTFGRNGAAAASTITIERMVQDGVELAELLSKKLQKNKIVLVGHSWGSILGIFMAKARPELFYAFVGTGQVADPRRNYAAAYAALVERASRDGNSRALQELNEVGPPPYKDGKGFAIQRKWSNLFEGADVFLASTLGFALTAPGYSLGDVNDWFEGQGVSAEHLVPQTSALDPKLLGGEFAVPVFVIQGAEDFTTPTSLAQTYLNSLHAPRKAFATIGGAGHFAVFTKQDVFLKELRARVLPLIR
ncbi:MAG TPA: alpha/beta hydrolase [Bryobacteraceae bacterium]|nr:alpha/beta hydrolase [Bryobacteraceae bacterium]